jgi:hypothetical protein
MREIKSGPSAKKIISGGTLGGRMPLAGAHGGRFLLAAASVTPVQGTYGRLEDFLEIYGKEKVYGSIP